MRFLCLRNGFGRWLNRPVMSSLRGVARFQHGLYTKRIGLTSQCPLFFGFVHQANRGQG